MNSHTMSSESTRADAEAVLPARVAQDEADEDGRDDPGLVEPVGDQVRAVGRDDRDRHLDQVVVREPHQALGDEAGDRAR